MNVGIEHSIHVRNSTDKTYRQKTLEYAKHSTSFQNTSALSDKALRSAARLVQDSVRDIRAFCRGAALGALPVVGQDRTVCLTVLYDHILLYFVLTGCG